MYKCYQDKIVSGKESFSLRKKRFQLVHYEKDMFRKCCQKLIKYLTRKCTDRCSSVVNVV